LSEAMTWTAREAAVSGETAWDETHRSLAKAFDSELENASRFASREDILKIILDDVSRRPLLDIEQEALDWVRQGRPELARRMLFGPDFANHKAMYQKKLDRMAMQINSHAGTTVEN